MALITFEREPSQPSAAEAMSLAEDGITWIPLRYHRRPPLISTAFDIVIGVWHCLRLAKRDRLRLFHGRGTVAAAIAYAAARLSGTRFFNDADGPLSQEYVDAGVWRRGSIAHRITAWAERFILARADAVAVLTHHRRAEIERDVAEPVVVLPCAVDTSHFCPDRQRGLAIRRQLGLSGTVLVYSGKAGGWYRQDLVLAFTRAACDVFGDVSLLVLTTDEPARFSEPAAAMGLKCVIRRASREEMPAFLSAADAGLSLLLVSPSKLACSPVKNAEYLACGLPVVSTPGAGDYPELLSRERVGVVLSALDAPALSKAATALRALLGDPEVRLRCRRVAVEQLGLKEVLLPRYKHVYERLLGNAPS
jgi:glycosyltransferase involved in cell wall biosynthesis